MRMKLGPIVLMLPIVIALSACHSYDTYNRLERFYLFTSNSKTKTSKATEVFGDDWERVCLVNKHSDTEVIQNALSRKFTFSESLNWFYISRIADFSEPIVLIYESKGVFFRMQPSLSKLIDGYPSSKHVLKTRATCFEVGKLYIRRTSNDLLELYEK